MKTKRPTHWRLLAAALAFSATAGVAAEAPEITCRVELDRAVLPVRPKQTAVVRVTLDAAKAPAHGERPPVNLAVVLDRSGSMHGTKLEKAKEGAIEALRRLTAKDEFSLVIYDHNVETLVPAQSAANTEWIEARIRGVQSGGNTALFGGVSQGASEVRKRVERGSVNRLILLSDGLANVGPSSPEELGRLGAALMKERIAVTTIGVGTDYNEDLMTRLSQQSDGNSYFCEDSKDLPRIFAAELGDVLSVVASQVILRIEFVGGTRPLRILGRDGRLSDKAVEIGLNQVYGGQRKYVLVEVEIPDAKAGTEREVAVARCAYDNVISKARAETMGTARVRFSDDETVVVQSANVDVQNVLLVNNAAMAKDQAIALWEQGKQKEAVQLLRTESDKARSQAAQFNLGQPAAESVSSLSGAATRLENSGLSKELRKGLRTESYQDRNQQEAK